jgi:hypothetical protein
MRLPSRFAPRLPAVLFALISGLWLALWAPLASALGLVGPVHVVEFYNTFLGHYFMTLDADEIASIDAGKAGPGWVRTGFFFGAYPSPPPANGSCDGAPAEQCLGSPVYRFYGTPGLGPNSHFFTADPAEAAGLDRPGTGWSLERKEFSIPVPDASGQCPSGLAPVYRLYNMRWMFNDSNHRYVTSPAERARMQAMGWFDEGPRFCAYFAGEEAIKSFQLTQVQVPSKIRASAECEDESLNDGPCIAVNNLAAPDEPMTAPVPTFPGSPTGYEFFDRTGLGTSTAFVVNNALPAPEAAADVFVQQSDHEIGIHVDTLNRGANSLSSVNPLYQLHTSRGPELRDDRFFPFGAYESGVELALSFELRVRRVNLRTPTSAAYGHPTLEFIDTKSNHHVYFTILTYGTIAQGDYLAFDSGTGKVIVGTTFRTGASYGRSLRDSMLPTPSGFSDPTLSLASHGLFEFRMNRDEFRRVLASARTLDPAISNDPSDYLLDNFHFNNEVFGDGEIGLTLQGYLLQLLRRSRRLSPPVLPQRSSSSPSPSSPRPARCSPRPAPRTLSRRWKARSPWSSTTTSSSIISSSR